MNNKNNIIKLNHGTEKVITISTLAELIGVDKEDIFASIFKGCIPTFSLSGDVLAKFKTENPSFKTNLNNVILLDYSMCREIVNRFEDRLTYFPILDCFFSEEIQKYKDESSKFDLDEFNFGKKLIKQMFHDEEFAVKNREKMKGIIESNGLGYLQGIHFFLRHTKFEYWDWDYRYFQYGGLLLEKGIIPNQYEIIKMITEEQFEDSLKPNFYASMSSVI